ncbi:hypothetical protein ABEF92_007584 [Exophiala dermatitidis]|uniref:DUF427 domain-containing protein n=1 Tax=Exophiala dermatitidis (strain ATCC 34100 / CBS 525.76 / NIH/UT8656) TaxID=858893 RepID=H6C4B5_EXODN|nr:uncharacterized protein HMPREF1120_06461 [Exophiala dermatitidis NIH/UT8656]EHY58451.1 hypothetical protein HMPREF1120_06461 [Exophiala dermatitidis NIH/UT8656]
MSERSLADLGSKLFNPKIEFRPRILDTAKRVRGVLDGQFIFDTTSAKLVWEIPYYPQYWIPKTDFLDAATFTEDKPISGIQSSTSKLSVKRGGGNSNSTSKSVHTLLVPDSFNSELAGYVKIDFKALDAWYEEQSLVLYHPKDPFHRVDILPSGRHVRVELDGVVLADTTDQGGVMSLWETNFPARWYLPQTAVRWEYLTPSATKTGCPYKGEASYYNAVIDGRETKDVVWWYPNPTLESGLIRGMLCFYPDKVDTWVDGKRIEKIGMPNIKKVVDEEDRKRQENNMKCWSAGNDRDEEDADHHHHHEAVLI